MRWFATAYPMVMLALFAVGFELVFTGGRWTATVRVPEWIRHVGVAAMAAGTLLLLWAQRSLGHHYCPRYAARRPLVVVQHGPYRWLGHPMYVANLITIAWTACASGSWLLAIAWTVVAVAYRIAARSENTLLREVAARAPVTGQS